MFYWPFDSSVNVLPGWWRGAHAPRGFGSRRPVGSGPPSGRLHAGCDLVIRGGRGTDIHAVCDGEVLFLRDGFIRTPAPRRASVVSQLVVKHEHEGFEPFIIRYGEILDVADGGIPWPTNDSVTGNQVTGNQVIAKVGQLRSGGTMLHFELYASGNPPPPSFSIAGRFHRPPITYTEEEKIRIHAAGWHWTFQRRLDLADPTLFLRALAEGSRPDQPTAFIGRTPTIYVMEELIVPGNPGVAPIDTSSTRTVRPEGVGLYPGGLQLRNPRPHGSFQVPDPRDVALRQSAREFSDDHYRGD